MYNKEEFKKVVKKAVTEIFPDRELTILVEERSSVEQLCIKSKSDETVSTLFDFNKLKEIYDRNGVNGIKDFIKSCIYNCENNLEEIENTMKDFKSTLNIKVFDPIIKPHLVNCITKDLGDLKQALVLAKNDKDSSFQIYLSKENLDRFVKEMTVDDLWDLAKENLKKSRYYFIPFSDVPGISNLLQSGEQEDTKHTPVIFTTKDLQNEDVIKKMQKIVMNCKIEPSMFVLKNKDLSYTTSLLCDEELLSGLAQVFGESYYILPSSTLELFVIPESYINTFDEIECATNEYLKEMVYSVNKTLESNEVFTDEVFKYNKSVEELEFLGRYKRITVKN